MAGKINMAKALCVLIVASYVMACTPALTVPPTPTTTPSKTPTPSSTPTLTPSPTATATVTPNPSQIAEMLGMPVEVKLNDNFSYTHTYRIDGDYLRDDYNNTIAAVRENGTWRVLGENQEDVNLKYGQLADSLGMEVFGGGWREQSYLGININVVFTGEYEVVDWFYQRQNQTIKDYRGWVVYRDGDGTVQKVLISMFSPDLPGLPYYRFTSFNGGYMGATLDEILQIYQPGQRFKVTFVWDGPQMIVIPFRCFNDVCSEDRNRQAVLRYQQDANIREFAKSWQDDNPISSFVPEGLVLPASSIYIIDS